MVYEIIVIIVSGLLREILIILISNIDVYQIEQFFRQYKFFFLEFEEMFKAVDKDGSNTIDQKEFLEMMALKVKEKDSEEELILAFKVFDLDYNGYITVAQLRHILTDIKDYDGLITELEIEELIAEVDEDGQVNYVEFVKTMNSKWSDSST